MLIAEVEELVRAHRLHPFDAEWIARLRPEAQLKAARKCMRPSPTFIIHTLSRSTITHGTSRRLGAAS
mgnify:CR=1 FL=1